MNQVGYPPVRDNHIDYDDLRWFDRPGTRRDRVDFVNRLGRGEFEGSAAPSL